MYHSVLVTCLIFCTVSHIYSISQYPHLTSIFEAIFDSNIPDPVSTTPPSMCSGCSKKHHEIEQDQMNDRYSVTEEELTALRIEYIKNQILRKLRLKKKPTVTVTHLPKPVTEDETLLPKGHGNSFQNALDDYYGKTTQVIIFPYEDQARCPRKVRYPSVCLPFQMPFDLHASDLSTAELWFHKAPDEEDSHNQTFMITEVAHWDTKKSFQKTTPIAILQTNVAEGWLKVDVAQVIRNWLEYQDSPTHAINVACKTCAGNTFTSPVSFKPSYKPFLVISTHSQQRRIQNRRTKRSTNCSPGENECCKESLYISFAEIGWDDWIIQPAGYNAYFCKGSCSSAASITLSATQHNSILQKFMYGPKRQSSRKLELQPCCAASQFQPLQLFYMDNNKTITSKILSNMIVNSCGCM